MNRAELMSRTFQAGVKVTATLLKLEANKSSHAAACVADDRTEQDKLRSERHVLTDLLLDQQGEQHHYLRLALLARE